LNFYLNKIFSLKNDDGKRLHDSNILASFYNYSRHYITNTKSNIERELGEGYLGNEILLDTQLTRALATMICQSNTQIHNLQKLILLELPDTAGSLLFPKDKGITIKILGDAIVLFQCKKITKYKIIWNRKINGTCYHLFPINIEQTNSTMFFELRSRRILNVSNTITCEDRHNITYIKDIYDVFWTFTLPNMFEKLATNNDKHQKFTITLPILASYNPTLFHYTKSIPHRLTLLNLLSKQTDNLESLLNFKTTGHGNIVLGIAKGISQTIKTIGKTGLLGKNHIIWCWRSI